MLNELELKEQLPLMLEVLSSGAEYEILPRGESMLPLIRPGQDVVCLVAPQALRRRDICLYRRANGQFVLHRLERIEKDGTLQFRGDNQRDIECGVARSAVIARVCAVKKAGKRCAPAPFFYCLTHISPLARRLRFGK